ALDAGARPRAVVVDFQPTLLASDPAYNQARWPELLGQRDAIDLARVSRAPDQAASIAARRLLPSLRLRPPLRDLLGGLLLRGDWPSRRERFDLAVRRGFYERN